MKIGNKVVTWKRPVRLESGPQIKSPVKTQPKRKSKEQLKLKARQDCILPDLLFAVVRAPLDRSGSKK